MDERESDKNAASVHERWALFRFSVIGALLAAPPARGDLRSEFEALAARSWRHPLTSAPCQFGVSTIERWFYQARGAGADPVKVLRKRVRKDAGQSKALGPKLKDTLLAQYRDHKSWSYLLHHQNLAVLVEADSSLGTLPSYATVQRHMKATGLQKRKRRRGKETEGTKRAEARLESREVRSYEVAYVNGLWHADFHVGSRKVLIKAGAWQTPVLFGALDDRSRLCCHLQWYLITESAESIVHGMMQAIQKRGLCRALMTDRGKAELSVEFSGGLGRLGILHEPTLGYSPYQNGKQESFWGQVEGRLLPMLEGVTELTLPMLNEATQAWVEQEYNRQRHSEIGEAPITRFMRGPDVGRPSPTTDELRLAFMAQERRTQRRSDGTVSLLSVRFEVPSRYRHMERVTLRYCSWDLGYVYMIDERSAVVLARLFPLDRDRNAGGVRRSLEPHSGEPAVQPKPGMAPLMKKYLDAHRKTGLPPAYLPYQAPSLPAAQSQPGEDEQ